MTEIDAEFYEAVIAGNKLYGKIYNDKKERFTDGTVLSTSTIVSITDNVVETRNSRYTFSAEPYKDVA